MYEEVIYPDFGIELQEGLDLGFDDSGKKNLRPIFAEGERRTNRSDH